MNLSRLKTLLESAAKGGPGSGNIGHAGLAGAHGGSLTGGISASITQGSYGALGKAEGDIASDKQVSFIQSIVEEGVSDSDSAFSRSKIGLERVFGEGAYDKIKDAGERSAIIRKRVVGSFLSWQTGFDPSKLTKTQASTFLKGAQFGHSRVRTDHRLERATSGFIFATGLPLEAFFSQAGKP